MPNVTKIFISWVKHHHAQAYKRTKLNRAIGRPIILNDILLLS